MSRHRKSAIAGVLCAVVCITAIFVVREYVQRRDIETISMKDALADYDYMWEVLEGNYPFLKMAERKFGLSMDALKATYRGNIEELGKQRVDFCDYYELMQTCIGKFNGLAHLSMYTPNNYQSQVILREDERQANSYDDLSRWRSALYNDPTVKARYNYLAEEYGISSKEQKGGTVQNLTFQDISEDIAYVKIKSFNISHLPEDQKKLSNWFLENSQKKYLIIDITGNGGGYSKYWKDLIVAPNIDEKVIWTNYYITPYGEESREQFAMDGVGVEKLNPNLEELSRLPKINKEDLSEAKYYGSFTMTIKPAYEKKIFDGQIFLLVDDSVYSAADNFAMFCKDTGFATIVGENTGGDGGGINVYETKLPKSGLIIRYRAMHGLNADGSSNVEFGTTPDVVYSGRKTGNNIYVLGICLDYIESVDNEY